MQLLCHFPLHILHALAVCLLSGPECLSSQVEDHEYLVWILIYRNEWRNLLIRRWECTWCGEVDLEETTGKGHWRSAESLTQLGGVWASKSQWMLKTGSNQLPSNDGRLVLELILPYRTRVWPPAALVIVTLSRCVKVKCGWREENSGRNVRKVNWNVSISSYSQGTFNKWMEGQATSHFLGKNAWSHEESYIVTFMLKISYWHHPWPRAAQRHACLSRFQRSHHPRLDPPPAITTTRRQRHSSSEQRHIAFVLEWVPWSGLVSERAKPCRSPYSLRSLANLHQPNTRSKLMNIGRILEQKKKNIIPGHGRTYWTHLKFKKGISVPAGLVQSCLQASSTKLNKYYEWRRRILSFEIPCQLYQMCQSWMMNFARPLTRQWTLQQGDKTFVM